MANNAESPYIEEELTTRRIDPALERLIRRACFYSGIDMIVNDPTRLNPVTFTEQRRAKRKRNMALDELRRFLGERLGWE